MKEAPAPPFDRVVISENGTRRELSVGDFLQLPLDVRIHYILARTVAFYAGEVLVDRRVALSHLRATSSHDS